ncbi:Sporulation stage III, protein AG [Alkaliphilus metalliredigens QYMF]|uniref:Sporulation stage III, protein AG n=1 Tax=Alkaliphilus metalliredigens (strain QYMF) TaxID=293826 RepID=A6TR33_ALKMQ|nr:stage III sporulation protein AG [Alkaliphilus metalliredigens]ABR48651.1 Sporulation stage III, protein AG [Alkaliphilus metalliredigens QYMF]
MSERKWDEVLKGLLSKKYVANIIVLMAIAVIALIVSSDFLAPNTKPNNIQSDPLGDTLVQQNQGNLTDEERIEGRLKAILENIRGAGTVEVMITFEIGPEIIPASNVVQSQDLTEEKDANGGERTITSTNTNETIVTTNDSGGNNPLVLKEIKPQINGVIVVAQGAENAEVKRKLYDAVRTVLQVSGHKVQIYPKK